MLSIRSVRAASRAPFARFSLELRRHRSVTHVLAGALCLIVAVAVSAGGVVQAGLDAVIPASVSILPESVGIGINSGTPVTLKFGEPMDPVAVESAVRIRPVQPLRLRWSADLRSVEVWPAHLWLTDQRYVVALGERRFTFTTQTAPRITAFGVHQASTVPVNLSQLREAESPADGSADVSARTAISLTFSANMDRSDVERAFVLSPAVPGVFIWSGSVLTFTPAERFSSDARYAVSLSGAHDADGNPLGGDTSFSFTTRAGAQLVRVSPAIGGTNVTDTQVVLWFSQSMQADASAAVLSVTDLGTGAELPGEKTWDVTRTQLIFTPNRAFALGHRFAVRLANGAVDADGNPVNADWTFSTPNPVVRRAVKSSASAPATPSGLVDHALSQINFARAAYGLSPLLADPTISAVSAGHAWDMMANNYFSHDGLDGRTYSARLRDAGISFGYAGENICYYSGQPDPYAVLDWCQSTFMAEPYPGVSNHKGNILGVHFSRVGVGVAQVGSKVIVVWDFTD